MTGACLCLPVVSVLFLIKAGATAFIVLIPLSVFADSWYLAFVCIFFFFSVLTVSSYFIDFNLWKFSEAKVKDGFPWREISCVLLPGDLEALLTPGTTGNSTLRVRFFGPQVISGHQLV